MKSILALAAAAAAITMMPATSANAQECLNGYRELDNGVILACDQADMGVSSGELVVEAETTAEAMIDSPDLTGSVTAAAEPEPLPQEAEQETVLMRADGPGCINGYRELDNGIIFACRGEFDRLAAAAPQPRPAEEDQAFRASGEASASVEAEPLAAASVEGSADIAY